MEMRNVGHGKEEINLKKGHRGSRKIIGKKMDLVRLKGRKVVYKEESPVGHRDPLDIAQENMQAKKAVLDDDKENKRAA